MNLVVLGSTSVAGDAIVRTALGDPRVESVVAVSRRPLAHTHARLTVAQHIAAAAAYTAGRASGRGA